jgi:hypothetical protein
MGTPAHQHGGRFLAGGGADAVSGLELGGGGARAHDVDTEVGVVDETFGVRVKVAHDSRDHGWLEVEHDVVLQDLGVRS